MGPLGYIGIIVGALVLYLLLTFFINKNKHKVLIEEISEIAKKHNFELIEVKNQKYDFKLVNNDYDIYVKVAKIPTNSSVTINSKETWCLRWGGKRKGRNYPNMRYMNELVPFLRSNITSNDKDVIRLVILYPTCEVILKYLNESEIATVTPSSINHGFKVLKYKELDENFDKLFNKKEPKK